LNPRNKDPLPTIQREWSLPDLLTALEVFDEIERAEAQALKQRR
jgi:hypothetical protein